MTKSSNILPFITLAACAAAYLHMRSRQQRTMPSLITNMSNKPLPRGYRNNNPLNVRISSRNNWNGKIQNNTDGVFEQFTDMAYGYRAALITLRNYISNGFNTIAKMISRWAPESDNNNTAAYINNVCTRMSQLLNREITPFDVVNRNDRDTLTAMAYAMSISENGTTYKYKDPTTGQTITINLKQEYNLPDMEIINEGWRLI